MHGEIYLLLLLVNHRKRVPFTVVADNSLFTVYSFQAQCFNSASVKPKSDHLPQVSSELRYLLLHLAVKMVRCIFLTPVQTKQG